MTRPRVVIRPLSHDEQEEGRPRVGRLPESLSESQLDPWLVVALAVAAVLRLSGLGEKAFWLDEVFSLVHASQPPTQLLSILPGNQSPLFFWLAHAWQWFSENEAWLRLPSALLGLVLVGQIYALAALVAGRGAGRAAASLAAVSPYLVHYSQEYRVYALLMVAGTLGTHLLVKCSDPDRSPGRWALRTMMIVAIAQVGFHPFALFLCAMQIAFVLPALARVPRSNLLAVVLMALLIVVGGATLSRSWSSLAPGMSQGPSGEPPTSSHFADIIGDSVRMHTGGTALSVVVIGLLAIIGVWKPSPGLSRISVLALCLYVVPAICFYALGPSHFFDARYVCQALPHLLVLAGVGVDRVATALRWIPASVRWMPGPGESGLILGLVCSWSTLCQDHVRDEYDARFLAESLSTRLRDGDRIFVQPFYLDNLVLFQLDRTLSRGGRICLSATSRSLPMYYWYYRKEREGYDPGAYRGPKVDLTPVTTLSEVTDAALAGQRSWLVTQYPESLGPRLESRFVRLWTHSGVNAFGPFAWSPVSLFVSKTPSDSGVSSSHEDGGRQDIKVHTPRVELPDDPGVKR